MASRSLATLLITALSLEMCLQGAHPAFAQASFEPNLRPGQRVPNVHAIACNSPDQLEAILLAYSISYQAGKAAFEMKREIVAHDAAMGRDASACDKVWFTAIVAVRTVSPMPYSVHFADGSIHRRYVIEVKPVSPDQEPAKASYFISSLWHVRDVDAPT